MINAPLHLFRLATREFSGYLSTEKRVLRKRVEHHLPAEVKVSKQDFLKELDEFCDEGA